VVVHEIIEGKGLGQALPGCKKNNSPAALTSLRCELLNAFAVFVPRTNAQ
jgi:hypothetical protein